MAQATGFALKLSDSADLALSDRIEKQTKTLPVLKKGQVRVKMHYAPVNPSDLVHLMGKYGVDAKDGAFVGFEGSGVVVEANAGLYGKYLMGKRVAVSAQPGMDGLWSDYAITAANLCLPLRDDISMQQGSTLIVNPCTSVCMVERARQLGSKGIVLNAAASQVGKGAIRYAKMLGLSSIAILRSDAQKQALYDLGASVVLNSNDDDFHRQLKEACEQHQAKVLLDAVADSATPQTMRAMPKGTTAIVYGRLTDTHDPIGGQFVVSDIIFKDQKIEGFWLANYFYRSSPWHIYQLSKKVQKLFAEGVFNTDIYGEFGFDEFKSAVDHYSVNKSDGKVLLKLI
ncbi:zinc-binding dehydrogenase [Paraferrimonas sp. SM1919]|uniref:zinc-binding dehydrogenase n=1 Tax=Paraferrimonas sp. SM1919 TaxID=2662263 RepID=UPI0013D24615|nr:zinc-binding dehydrogenase [Paraferrimonas sp. SM1919]